MTDKELIDALRDYARLYMKGSYYDLNPGIALMVANRMEELATLLNDDIKIKFGLGDRVWFPEIYDGEYCVKKDGYIIDGVSVTNDRFGTSISYTLQGEYGRYRQNRLYSNYEEAKEKAEGGNCQC